MGVVSGVSLCPLEPLALLLSPSSHLGFVREEQSRAEWRESARAAPQAPAAGHCWRPGHLGQWPELHRVPVAAHEGTKGVEGKVDQTLLQGGRERDQEWRLSVCLSIVGGFPWSGTGSQLATCRNC